MDTSSRLYRTLDLVATVLIILVACSLLWGFWSKTQKQGDESVSAKSKAYEVGDEMGTLDGVNWSDAQVTAVVWLSSTCQYCDQSMEFYRRLVAKPRLGRVIGVSSEEPAEIQAYLLKNAVELDQVVSVPSGQLKFIGTPTLLLVDAAGVVTKSWIGKLRTKDVEALVLKAVR